MHKDNLEDFNYNTISECDGCHKKRHGTMLHAHDAMGLATPVLFLCDRCHKPNWYQKIIDGTMRFFKRTFLKAKYYATTTKAERSVRKARIAEARARVAARKEAA